MLRHTPIQPSMSPRRTINILNTPPILWSNAPGNVVRFLFISYKDYAIIKI